MQVNFVLLSDILTERLEKSVKQENVEKYNAIKNNEHESYNKKKTQLMYQIPHDSNKKMNLLGGVHLYN